MKLSALTWIVSALLAACSASQDQTPPEHRPAVVAAACADEPIVTLSC
jgi:hypothetical protein